mmetsp:Transcript_11754/g.33769  ORF Transcript_11754/g.33769 Transcript_11754/m.33769 type:complete len:319 (-) Transcript_11754:335-1291(-)
MAAQRRRHQHYFHSRIQRGRFAIIGMLVFVTILRSAVALCRLPDQCFCNTGDSFRQGWFALIGVVVTDVVFELHQVLGDALVQLPLKNGGSPHDATDLTFDGIVLRVDVIGGTFRSSACESMLPFRLFAVGICISLRVVLQDASRRIGLINHALKYISVAVCVVDIVPMVAVVAAQQERRPVRPQSTSKHSALAFVRNRLRQILHSEKRLVLERVLGSCFHSCLQQRKTIGQDSRHYDAIGLIRSWRMTHHGWQPLLLVGIVFFDNYDSLLRRKGVLRKSDQYRARIIVIIAVAVVPTVSSRREAFENNQRGAEVSGR